MKCACFESARKNCVVKETKLIIFVLFSTEGGYCRSSWEILSTFMTR